VVQKKETSWSKKKRLVVEKKRTRGPKKKRPRAPKKRGLVVEKNVLTALAVQASEIQTLHKPVGSQTA
jgi:hypothetical protein